MNVVEQGAEVIPRFTLDENRLVTIPKNRPPETVPAIESAGVGVLQPFHAFYQICMRGL